MLSQALVSSGVSYFDAFELVIHKTYNGQHTFEKEGHSTDRGEVTLIFNFTKVTGLHVPVTYIRCNIVAYILPWKTK
jgi:hypothetical protein